MKTKKVKSLVNPNFKRLTSSDLIKVKGGTVSAPPDEEKIGTGGGRRYDV